MAIIFPGGIHLKTGRAWWTIGFQADRGTGVLVSLVYFCGWTRGVACCRIKKMRNNNQTIQQVSFIGKKLLPLPPKLH